jgi:Tol biopolymer transport system component
VLGAAALTLPSAPAAAASTTMAVTARVSTTTGGGQANGSTYGLARVDGSGRFVFFETTAALVASDTNAAMDVYRKDRLSGSTTRVSLLGEADQISQGAAACDVTPDGRYVVFRVNGSGAAGPVNKQLWRRDLVARSSVLLSQSGDDPANQGSDSGPCGISDDGTRIVFTSTSTNLGVDGLGHVFLRRTDINTTTVVDKATDATVGNAKAFQAAISANGGIVAFNSDATNLVSGDSNAASDIFVRNLSANTTERVDTTAGGAQGNGDAQFPSLSANGRYVAFDSTASNLVADDDNAQRDVFRKDRQTGAVVRVSVTTSGVEGNGPSSGPAMTPDGRYVAFSSDATNLYPADTNGDDDAFRRDLDLERTDLASRRWDTISAGNDGIIGWPTISNDGRVVAFVAAATDLVPGDTNGSWDGFVRDFAVDLAPFTSAKAFVTQQLVDFAPPGVFPTPDGITAQAKLLAHGASSPDGFIVSRARSASWTAKRSPLIRLYWACFLRAPDLGGMTYWTNQLANGKTLAQVASQFALSSEFTTKYGSKTNQQFVTLIYQNIFERDPDAGGLAFWTGQLNAKAKTRGEVMVNFSESNEGKRFLAPQVDTINIALGMIRAMPTKAQLAAQITAQRAGEPAELFAQALRATPAYAARVTT